MKNLVEMIDRQPLSNDEKDNILYHLHNLPNPDDIDGFRINIISANTHYLQWKPNGGGWTSVLDAGGAEVNLKGDTGATGPAGAGGNTGATGPAGVRGPRGWRGNGTSVSTTSLTFTHHGTMAAANAILPLSLFGDECYVDDITGDGTSEGLFACTENSMMQKVWVPVSVTDIQLTSKKVVVGFSVITTISASGLTLTFMAPAVPFVSMLSEPVTVGANSTEFLSQAVNILLNGIPMNKSTEVAWVSSTSVKFYKTGTMFFPGDIITIEKIG